jgi:hypothetical protein
VGFGAAWDNNILLASEGDSQLNDFGFPVDSGLTLNYRGRRLNLSGSYGGSFVRYRTYDEINSDNQRGRAYLAYQATSRLKVFAEETFVDAPSSSALNLAGVPFYRTGSRTNDAGGGIEALIARHTTLVAGYMLRSVTFEERVGQTLEDGYEHDWTVSMTRAHSRRLSVGASYDFRREVLSEGQDRFNIQQVGVTAQYALTPTLAVSGLLGVAVLGAGLTHDASVGPAVEAKLTYTARRTMMSASYLRTFVPSFGFGGTFQNEEWIGTVHVPIVSSRVFVDGRVAWFDNDALEGGQPSLQSLWLSGTVGYHATRWMNVEVFVDRTSQDTQRPGGNVKRTAIGGRVVLTKPMRIR